MTRTDATQHETITTHKPLQRFLLIGAERSGSTMLRLMLDHHPELSCMFDSDFLVRFYPECRNASADQLHKKLRTHWHYRHSDLEFPEHADSYTEVIDDFLQQRATAHVTTHVGATIHHDFQYLPSIFGDVKYVHLIRDARPVAASVVRMGWSGNAYCGAQRWREAIQEVNALQKTVGPGRWLEVPYESLVRNPQPYLEQICAFLGVEYSPRMLSFYEDSTYSPVDASIADRWMKRLSPREIQQVEMAVGDLLDQKGYVRMFPAATPTFIERFMLRIDDRIRRMRFNCDRYGLYLVLARKLYGMVGMSRRELDERFQAIREAHIK